MKISIKKPILGIVAFLIVLFTMPLGHAAMIIMENVFGKENIFIAAIIVGFLGLVLLIFGIVSKKRNLSTILGLFAGLFVWTGWIEFAFVYYANRFGVAPLMLNGEIVTKPEYLIMPSSVGFWAISMIYYFFGSKSGCKFFNWFQKKLKMSNITEMQPTIKNNALTTFMEITLILWTFYMILLFAYDNSFFGDRHPVTYLIAYGSLLWSIILFVKLIRIETFDYAIKYSIPTVIIFWNFVEIMGRWNFFSEFWIEPQKYGLELLLLTSILIILAFIGIISTRHKKQLR
jgi:hypothetical protein